MSKDSDPRLAPPALPADLSEDERRRFRRVDLTIKARVLKENGEEEPCLVVNISAGGALLKAVNPPGAGEHVVLYIDEVGRHEGQVIRSAKHFFAVDYRGRRAKTKRTADNLTQTLNNRHMHLDRRAAPRIRTDQETVLTLENGESIACEILDISLTGASIAIDPRPELGLKVTVGRMVGKIVRRHEKGVGIVFTGPAGKMEEIIESTRPIDEPPTFGPAFATPFGKKGSPL
ncbi:MAG: PilZ domain-containing protein [Parvularculaceae bacterium]